jgi:hypothetical protein
MSIISLARPVTVASSFLGKRHTPWEQRSGRSTRFVYALIRN